MSKILFLFKYQSRVKWYFLFIPFYVFLHVHLVFAYKTNYSHLCMVLKRIYKSSMRFFSGSMLRNIASEKKSISFSVFEAIHVCICILICKHMPCLFLSMPNYNSLLTTCIFEHVQILIYYYAYRNVRCLIQHYVCFSIDLS